MNNVFFPNNYVTFPGVNVFIFGALPFITHTLERATGELTYEDFGKKFLMVESSGIKIMYIGYALKKLQGICERT